MAESESIPLTVQASLETMRTKYAGLDGTGLDLNEKTFLRYLKARNDNLDKASSMLDSTIQWRKDFGVSDLQSWMSILVKENATGKLYCRGYDKTGHSIIYMKPGRENTNDHDGNCKNLVYTMEKSVLSGMQRDTQQWKVVLIIDFAGYSMMNAPPMKTSLAVLSILQNHYPETLHKAFLVSPPWIFHTAYNVIQPFIDPVTKQKIQFLSGTPEYVQAKLLEEIDTEVLEASYGGSDIRPFEAEKYLQGSFDLEYYSILNQSSASGEKK